MKTQRLKDVKFYLIFMSAESPLLALEKDNPDTSDQSFRALANILSWVDLFKSAPYFLTK